MRINQTLMLLATLVAIVAFFNRNNLPPARDMLAVANIEPQQARTSQADFQADWQGRRYNVAPLFDYELQGVVVSYRQHDGNSRMHRQSDDHLNAADLCVVWGDNANHPDLNQISFYNGIFTCNFSTRSDSAWHAFDIYQISNNHLLSDDPAIRKAISDVSIGDQIYLRGVLAEYTSPNGATRGTSTTRKDTGDGACETIYVEEFSVIKPNPTPWRATMWGSLLLLLGTLVNYFRAPFKARQ